MKNNEDNEKAALARAYYLLGPLRVHSWNEPAVDRGREHQHAIAGLETVLSEVRLTLSKAQGLWWILDADIESTLSSIERLLKIITSALKQTRPAKRKGQGQPAKLLRDRLIDETLATICEEFHLSQETARPIVAKALRQHEVALRPKGIQTALERLRKRAKKPPQ